MNQAEHSNHNREIRPTANEKVCIVFDILEDAENETVLFHMLNSANGIRVYSYPELDSRLGVISEIEYWPNLYEAAERIAKLRHDANEYDNKKYTPRPMMVPYASCKSALEFERFDE